MSRTLLVCGYQTHFCPFNRPAVLPWQRFSHSDFQLVMLREPLMVFLMSVRQGQCSLSTHFSRVVVLVSTSPSQGFHLILVPSQNWDISVSSWSAALLLHAHHCSLSLHSVCWQQPVPVVMWPRQWSVSYGTLWGLTGWLTDLKGLGVQIRVWQQLVCHCTWYKIG